MIFIITFLLIIIILTATNVILNKIYLKKYKKDKSSKFCNSMLSLILIVISAFSLFTVPNIIIGSVKSYKSPNSYAFWADFILDKDKINVIEEENLSLFAYNGYHLNGVMEKVEKGYKMSSYKLECEKTFISLDIKYYFTVYSVKDKNIVLAYNKDNNKIIKLNNIDMNKFYEKENIFGKYLILNNEIKKFDIEIGAEKFTLEI